MSQPDPPHPGLIRTPTGPFGWLDAHLLKDDWLVQLGPDATAALVLLAIAADRRGASFYGRERMGRTLGMSRQRIDQALARLRDLGLVGHRPWRPGHPDGIWQLLPVPRAVERPRAGEPVRLAALLARYRGQR